jgi:hypothetical protein
MFVLDAPSARYPPWPAPLSRRLRQPGNGHARVAYVYPERNHGTFRYRVQNMLEALVLDPAVGASWFSAADLWCHGEILARADVIVLCHGLYARKFADLVMRARAAGRRVLLDIDDLVFDTRYVPMVRHYLDHPTSEAALDHWFANFSRYWELMRLRDGVIGTDDYLAARVREFVDLPVAVVPNCMNQAQLSASDGILAAKRRSCYRRDGRFHIGYFSGSQTHRRDFQLVEAALARFLEADPRLVLRLGGKIGLSGPLRRHQQRVEVLPMQDPISLQRCIGEVEITLAPLQDNAFTNCKSELKFFEAVAVGTLTFAYPVFAFRQAMEHRRTGFLAPAHRLPMVLREALHTIADDAEQSDAAADVVRARYQPAAQLPWIRVALFDGSRGPAPIVAAPA